jgi:FixJ family two-component response regulator
MTLQTIQVYIVEDEPSVATAYARLVRSARMYPRTFASVEDFMHSEISDENACVVSDVQFPGKSGLELPELLEQAGHRLPVIFVTAHDTQQARDTAQRVGGAAYFRKPVDDQALLDAITWAINRTPDE